MTGEEAREIVNRWFGSDKVGAIRRLRDHTGLSLQQANHYLMGSHSKEALHIKLCTDYVQSKEELRSLAIAERDRLNNYIQQLTGEIIEEGGSLKENVFDQPNEAPSV